MNRHARGIVLLVALASPFLNPSTVVAQAHDSTAGVPESIELEALLETAMAGTATPAVGALVMRDGVIAEIAVHGVRRSDGAEEAGIEDVWLIGSTGKPMTAALIARLVDRGVLSWDRPLSTLLPELAASMRPEYRSVTLTQLLSHRSGLPENLRDLKVLDTYFSDERSLQEQRLALIAAALQDEPAAPPGTEFAYSNTAFLVAAAAAEQATGIGFEELMRAEVFEPLAMTSAGFGPVPKGGLLGHRGGKPVTEPMRESDDGVPMVYSAAGNLHMSLGDWARFCLDQLAGSRGDGVLLKPATYRLMQTAQPGSSSGLDWGIQDSIAGRKGPVLVHGGSDGNWIAWAVLFPESNTGAIVVANAAADMGADGATQAVLGASFPDLAPEK